MLSPGTLIDGRYEIVGPLGHGGMGAVYRAKRPLLGDEVAIKVMHAAGPDDIAEYKPRFLRESRACAQLRHPNIVSILDFSVSSSGAPYLVMELLSGPSLRDELSVGGAMDPRTVATILTSVAGALQLAHDRGITHRDLKPANIVAHRYESGERVYKVIDFGLVSLKTVDDETRLTNPNMFLGTMAYAAPEQLLGDPIDPRSDIYALGVIAYEMLTGQLPFDDQNKATVITKTLTTQPVAPGRHRTDLPPALDAVIMRALEKEPEQRWQSVIEFVRALHEAAGGPVAQATASTDEGLLSRYDLGEMLGRGRMGSLIHKGTHRSLGTPVAIRILRRDEQPNWDAVRGRFLVEAQTLQVAHPNLSQVRDFGEDERLVYVVTDFVEGVSLRQALAAGPMDWPHVQHLFRQMLDATAALNARGGFITGVNPDMIRISGGRPPEAIVPDGPAHQQERVVMSSAGIRSVQDVLATMREQELRGEEANERELPYIAPELLLGRGPDVASDVFTLAVLAYEMTTGRVPFRGKSLPELIGQMLQTTPMDARGLNASVPEAVSQLLTRSLAADPAKRPSSAGALLDEVTL
jgi:serine/threonine protein kinase